MHKELLYYSNINIIYGNSSCLRNIPGIDNYKLFAKWFDPSIGLNDRTQVIKFPIRTKNINPIPEYDKNFKISYRECASLKIQEMDKIYQRTGKKFRLLYSGGVDSSVIFASFIDYYGVSKTKELLEISCSRESINENPWLWDRYIRKENFNIVSSHDHNHHWSDDRIILMGEGNDQLFGKSEFAGSRGYKNLYSKINPDDLAEYLNKFYFANNDNRFTEILIKIGQRAPFAIDNLSLLVWWFNFALTWDSIMYRVLSQAIVDKLPVDSVELGLIQFFNTENFQKWSLKYHDDYREEYANIDRFKFDSKKMILDVLDIPEYKNKGKFMSFPRVHSLRPGGNLVDTDLNIYKQDKDYLLFVNQENDFINMSFT